MEYHAFGHVIVIHMNHIYLEVVSVLLFRNFVLQITTLFES